MSKTHGCAQRGNKTSEYMAWQNMKGRCLNDKIPTFKRYGGRGISICARWVDSFENFINDMGLKPSCDHSLDRIDNNENYSPANCKWSTQKEQVNNREMSIKHKGELAIEASQRLNGSMSLVSSRLKKGWDMEKAFNHPRIWKKIIYNNESAVDASKRLGGYRNLVNKRLRAGWSIKEAFIIPKGGKRE